MKKAVMTFDLSMMPFKGSVAIIGAGQDGTDLLGLLLHERDVNMVCVVDKDLTAPGVILAHKHNIPVFLSLDKISACRPDIICITDEKSAVPCPLPEGAELINFSGVRLILSLLKKHYVKEASLEESAEKAKSYHENMLDNIADSVITTGTDGLIVEFNPGASRIFGYTHEEMVGRHIEEIWTTPEKRREILSQMERDGFISNYETQLQTKDGRTIDTNLTLSYITNESGERLGTVGITKDITEKKRLERELEERNAELHAFSERLEETVIERTQELRRANAELERSNRVKSQFIATMSHELRTPLNSILGFSELLGDDREATLSVKQKRYVANIYNSGTHLLQLINNILDIAKIESGKMSMNPERFSVEIAINEVAGVVRPLLEKKRLSFSVMVDPDIAHITADRIKLKQILYNLLSNAVKFTPEHGSVSLCAKMTSSKDIPVIAVGSPDEHYLSISITDTGIGIKKTDMERIFSEFEQVDSSYARRYEGSGLGLALTRRMVDLHGGEIFVESEEDKGSTFTVILPIGDVVAAAPAPAACVCVPDPNSRENGFSPRSSAAPLIVVVEDDAMTRELMTLYLAEGGYRVATVKTGDTAIERIRELSPFAVILDVMLPGKDGWEILQELKLDNELRDIPVMMATMVENSELGFALGAADYLVKPIDRSNLISKLEQLNISSKRHRRPISILCIDDHPEVLELLTEILETGGYTVLTADSGRAGIEKAVAFRPDLIILDLMMPDLDGFEVARELKSNPTTLDIPICILTAKDITVAERLELSDKIETCMQKSFFSKEQLLTHIRDLEVLYPARAGLIDPVSGLFDRCYFELRLAQEVNRSFRHKKSFSVITLDLDNFTQYRELIGARYANTCIRRIADFCRKTLRGSDTIVRYGYDEYASILVDTMKDGALVVAQRIHRFIESYPFHGIEQLPNKKITSTIAVLGYPNDAKSPEELMSRAYALLRTGKESGGGKIVTAE